MNHYTDHDGNPWTMNQTRSRLSQDLYADLVAAIHIAHAFEAKCGRLEAMLDNAGDLAHNLQEQSDSWATAFSRLQHERDLLVAENNRLRAELDRLELVS